MNRMICNSRIFLGITGLWLSLGLAAPAVAAPPAPHVTAQAELEFPTLNQSFKGARAETTGKLLRVSTGKIQRSWELTERGLRTVSLKDLRGGNECADTQAKYHCGWQFPGIGGNVRLLSLSASESNDQGFTSDHLKVVATFEYEADNLLLQYVIWAYPDSEGLRTQCRVKLMQKAPADSARDSDGEGITDSLPISLESRKLQGIGYYAGTQNRNTHEQEILKQEIQADCPQEGQIDWASIVAVRGKLSGLVMLKESHKCANTPKMGANTGRFTWDAQGLRNTGTGWHVDDLSSDRYRDCWASWVLLYQGGDDDMALALTIRCESTGMSPNEILAWAISMDVNTETFTWPTASPSGRRMLSTNPTSSCVTPGNWRTIPI
jgi:hypothetical protein